MSRSNRRSLLCVALLFLVAVLFLHGIGLVALGVWCALLVGWLVAFATWGSRGPRDDVST
jgi:hypothetical protein